MPPDRTPCLFALVLAYYLHDINPNLIQFTEQFGIKWYGVSYVAGFVVSYLLMRMLARRGYGQLKEDEVSDFITLVALFGVLVGGRLGYMLLYTDGEFFKRPWMFFQLWDGGMASHGGIAGVAAVIYYYARKKNYNWIGIGDNMVSVAPIGIFFGRIANFINGELYGKAASVSWAVQFPGELERPEIWREANARLPEYANVYQMREAVGEDPQVDAVLHEVLTPRHPSQIYQALMEGLALFLILFLLRLKYKNLPYGVLTGLFFILYATFRIWGEVYRAADYDIPQFWGIQRGQFYSIFMYAAGFAFLPYAYRDKLIPLWKEFREKLATAKAGEEKKDGE